MNELLNELEKEMKRREVYLKQIQKFYSLYSNEHFKEVYRLIQKMRYYLETSPFTDMGDL